MDQKVIVACFKDARGSVKNIGQLIHVEMYWIEYGKALERLDGLAVRQAVEGLFTVFGWGWSAWMVKVTRNWPRHPSQRPRLPA